MKFTKKEQDIIDYALDVVISRDPKYALEFPVDKNKPEDVVRIVKRAHDYYRLGDQNAMIIINQIYKKCGIVFKSREERAKARAEKDAELKRDKIEEGHDKVIKVKEAELEAAKNAKKEAIKSIDLRLKTRLEELDKERKALVNKIRIEENITNKLKIDTKIQDIDTERKNIIAGKKCPYCPESKQNLAGLTSHVKHTHPDHYEEYRAGVN